MKTATELFTEARDFLIYHRTDYEAAYKDYQTPQLEKFNWALDWFDVLAKKLPNCSVDCAQSAQTVARSKKFLIKKCLNALLKSLAIFKSSA